VREDTERERGPEGVWVLGDAVVTWVDLIAACIGTFALTVLMMGWILARRK
jgi:hypothetical protein